MDIGNQIWKRLNSDTEWMQGKVSPTFVKDKIDELIKPYGAKVRLIPQKFTSKKHWFTVGGEYVPGQYQMPISIEISYDRERGHIYFTKKRKERFIFLINQTVQHELVHKQQFKTSGDDKFYSHHFYFTKGKSFSNPHRLEYLAVVEEIDAYAHDLAMEIRYFYPFDDADEVMLNINNYPLLDTWRMYRRAFKGASWKHVREELLQKTYTWLPQIREKFVDI
jgi:hypothetical protein